MLEHPYCRARFVLIDIYRSLYASDCEEDSALAEFPVDTLILYLISHSNNSVQSDGCGSSILRYLNGTAKFVVKKKRNSILPGGESNPAFARDRRVY